MKEYQNIPGFKPSLLSEPFVQHLLGLLSDFSKKLDEQGKKLEELEAEVRKLKKLPKKPDLKPSKLDEPDPSKEQNDSEKKRAGSSKRKKKENLEIHDYQKVKADSVPTNWKLVGYKNYIIQDFIVRANNIAYQLEIWKSPDGTQELIAQLPAHLQQTDFGSTLKGYILHQYYECGVTQPLILIALRDYGVDISSGQISAILIENKETFHKEKESLLAKAIEISEELRTDDTGARHRFKNGYCNCINSDLFTYFTTSYSKSRLNFLNILRLGRTDYYLNQSALDYMQREGLCPKYLSVFQRNFERRELSFKEETELTAFLEKHNFTAAYALRTIKEALLIGSIIQHGLDPTIMIHSDGAGQFNLFVHSLCWKHAERPLVKLKCYHPIQVEQLKLKRGAFWQLYQDLKAFKINPIAQQIPVLESQFDELCDSVTNFAALNQVLKELKAKKDKLLVVLSRPNASLHNNDSERDIREYVKRRKISAGTRSENGRKARDTFLSLKKTCRKLGISFWQYLLDRLQNLNDIPPLCQIMEDKVKLANI